MPSESGVSHAVTRKGLSLPSFRRISTLAAALVLCGAVASRVTGAPQHSAAAPAQPAPQTTAPATQGRGPGQDVRPWWKDPLMAKEVGLTPVQVTKIDRIFDIRQKQIKAKADEYTKLKADLDRMMRERTAKPEEIEEQARRVMYPRLDIDVSRWRMLYEMSQVMSAEQNTRMRAMFDRLDQERRDALDRLDQERARRGRGNLPRP
jgi:Spy/CpxP family protein refolding chaperone